MSEQSAIMQFALEVVPPELGITYCGNPKQYVESAFLYLKVEAEKNKRLTILLRRVLDDLPHNRDWLDPVLENQIKDAVGYLKENS